MEPLSLRGLLPFVLFIATHSAIADIYSFTAEDGTLHLSNVPTDSHYEKLVAAEETPAKQEKKTGNFDEMITSSAKNYGLEAALLRAVIRVESEFDPRAVSKKGAVGLMQIMPETGKRYGALDLFDPVENIATGAKYLKDLLALFRGDLSLALAAYNAGENTVIRYGNRIPPFMETERYVPKVLAFYRKYLSGRS